MNRVSEASLEELTKTLSELNSTNLTSISIALSAKFKGFVVFYKMIYIYFLLNLKNQKI